MTATTPAAIETGASSLRRDLLSAYAASGAKLLSWAVVSALLFRKSPNEFAMLALIRATIGILNYTSLGLAPAIIHLLPQTRREVSIAPAGAAPVESLQSPTEDVLDYARPMPRLKKNRPPLPVLYTNAWVAALGCGCLGLALLCIYAANFESWHRIVGPMRARGVDFIVLMIGSGVVLRLMSDAAGAMLQASQRIAIDNRILAAGDLLWMVSAAIYPDLAWAAEAYLLCNLIVFAARGVAATRLLPDAAIRWSAINRKVIAMLLSFGAMVTLAQVADYLYAPTDYILITRLLSPSISQAAIAAYAPAIQIDAALLMLVTGLASVLLPKAAVAYADEDIAALRTYYLRGTLASFAMLVVASVVVYALSPWLLRAWLGDAMPQTQLILPLVLFDTTIGGSSAVGRSILLGMGKVKAFAASVIIAGLTNVICSYMFVAYFHLGLRGIVLGTVVAVIGRCAIWTPWYVIRTLRASESRSSDHGATAPPNS